MKRSVLSVISTAVAALAIGLLRCNSVLGGGALTPEPCTADTCGPCTDYCNSIMKQCGSALPGQSPNGEYLSADICIKTCSANYAYWTTNNAVSNDTDTFGCRQEAQEAGICATAGPLGGGTAGCATATALTDPCTTFCNLEVPLCGEAGVPQYDNVDDCISYCKGRGPSFYVLADGGSDLVPHLGGDDTLNCRMWHLENAMSSGLGFGPMPHCFHTGKTGAKDTAICIPPQDAGEDAADE